MSTLLGWLRLEPGVEQPPTRVRRDWGLVVLVAGITVAEVVLREALVWRPLTLVFGLGLALTMLWRRTYPLAMVVLVFGALLVADLAAILALGQPFVLYAGAFVLVLVYSLFRWGTAPQAAIGLALVVTEWLVSVTTDFTGPTDAVGGLVVLLFVAALGVAVRYRAIARTQQLEQVRSQEREMLSRELHDTVAHHVSAIAIQAQAGRFLVSAQHVEGAAQALAVIEDEASRALTEMRTMVGSLRRHDGAAQPALQRGVADISALATTDDAPGLRVEVERRGDLDGLPFPVQAALYRVAQEAVTNAQRHARHGKGVQVVVSGEEGTVGLSVSDDGERTSMPNPGPSGYGLVGMAERVSLLGGTLQAGPGPEHGWTVRASIPRHQAAP